MSNLFAIPRATFQNAPEPHGRGGPRHSYRPHNPWEAPEPGTRAGHIAQTLAVLTGGSGPCLPELHFSPFPKVEVRQEIQVTGRLDNLQRLVVAQAIELRAVRVEVEALKNSVSDLKQLLTDAKGRTVEHGEHLLDQLIQRLGSTSGADDGLDHETMASLFSVADDDERE